MGIETNLNQSPYFDDFNENKNFHRVLFRPGFAVQARELTQLQTILQNQIERFANRVVYDGKIVSGVGLKTETIDFVKLRDKDANNRVLLLGDFFSGGVVANATVTGATTGMTAQLIDVAEGSEAAAPNYLSLFVKYTNSGSNNTTKTFSDNEVLLVRRRANNEFLVAANTITSSSTGLGYRATVSDGVIYHKGNFVRVAPQSVIVEKYNTTPTKKVGFETRESIIDSNADSSLLDNATGATNFSAPGANRLKLTPTLAVRDLTAANTTTFFSIANIEQGKVIQRVNDELAGVNALVAERIYETNGNFAVEPFNIRIRENLKRTNNLGLFENGDSNKLVAQIEPAIGYVGGNRVSIENTVNREFDKATDFEVKDARILGQTIGNYVVANEVVGTWDFQGLRTVSLRSAQQQGYSGLNLGAQSAQGTEIGTAVVRGIQWDTGTAGTAAGQFRIYLFDVKMNTGFSFADVRGLYINNSSGPKSMADVILDSNGDAKLQATGQNTLVFPFTQKGTKTLKDSSDNVDTQWVYRTERSVNFANNGIGTLTLAANSAHTGGTEGINDTGTLTPADRRNFIIVTKSAVTSAGKTGTISAFSGNTVTGSGTNFNGDYSVGDFITFTQGANTATARITNISSDTSIDVANTFAWTGSALSIPHRQSFPSGYIFDLTSNGSITSTTSSASINLGRTFLTNFNASVYLNVSRTDAVQTAKTVNKDKYIHINLGSHPNNNIGPWSLGVSDAYKLLAVYKGSNTGVGTTDTDVTDQFELDTGMKDAFYDTSSLRLKSTSSLALTASDGLMVKFNYFGRDRSSGIGYLSVDSYPIDDVSSSNTTAITTAEIPVFKSPSSGVSYDLRDAIDMRPIRSNSVTPSATGTVASAPTNPAVGTTFNIDADGAYLPTPDENFQADVQFYLPRKDRIVLTQEGAIEVIKGIPALTPKTPDARGGSMTLAILNIPVFPSLSPYSAQVAGRQDYAVKLNVENNRRYTMADLRAVETRVKNLEYYSSLNALEASAKNKQLFGETGIDRFKNGFLVDNFDGHNIADSTKKGYLAAIDRNNTQLRPSYVRNDVSLSKDVSLASTNVTQTGNLVTLSYTNTSLINQQFSSKLRNPVQELTFNWKGEVILDPSMDNTPDITTLPDIQVDFDGMYSAIEAIANETGVTGIDWGNWQTTSVSTNVNVQGDTTTTTTQTQQIINGIQTSISPSTETFSIGNFVENVAVRNYMRSRLIEFTGTRMKPNTRVFPYFDDELVTGYCTPANSSFANTAAEGSALITDSTGTVFGIFRVPNDDVLKFRVGTRRFTLKDVANTQTQSSLITTSAHGDYTSIPLDITQRGSSINMVVPQISKERVTSNRTLTNVRVEVDRDDGGDSDPLSQTFSINTDDAEGAFITKLDLYFGRKSSTYPITVQLREVENGYPTETVVPFGSKTLQASEVSANSAGTGGGSDATSFVFPSPVFLQNNKEYAFTIIPGGNSDEYALWVAELGGIDVDTNELIHKQPSSGVLFTSANDRTWSPIQSEDVKFNLYRANFTRNTGTVYLENDEIDYFSVDNLNGTFNNGEKIISESVLTFSNNDSIAVGTVLKTYAAAVGTANAHFANGVVRQVVASGSGSVTVKVDNYGTFPTSGTSANALNVFTGANTWIGNTTAFSANTNNGFVKFVDQQNGKLHIDNSSGGFANGFIRGQVSGASARITTVDNIVMNTLIPKIPQITYANTSANWNARTTSTSGVINSAYVPIDIGEENNFIDAEKKIYGKTGEAGLSAVDGSRKTLVLRGTFATTDTRVSPVIDTSRTNGIVIENVINNSVVDEHKEVGNSLMRYMTRPVELADGNEAEDLKVFLTAYKPSGTDVTVYARIHNPEDAEGIDDKDFTPLLQITSSNLFSDSVDTTDFKEFEFGFRANTDGQGFLTTANSHARLNTSNNEVVAYRAGDGSIHHTYKTFAIKIVMTSTGTNIVPLVRDMRAIALQK